MTATPQRTEDPAALTSQIELDIEGMTCASCANRIERKLNKLDGVRATVNYATEQASVAYPTDLAPQRLVDTVVAAGYQTSLPSERTESEPDDPTKELRERLVVSATLTVPVVLVSMIPALQAENWQWLALALAAPVAIWGAWPFHRAAVAGARHANATMDTLISLGVLAAFGWSLYSLFFGTAGQPGMTHGFELTAATAANSTIYLEVAASVTVFILTGRFLEARAKRRAGAALRSLFELGAKDVTVCRDGTEVQLPISALRAGETFLARPGEKIATDGTVTEGTSTVDFSMVTGESVPVEVAAGDEVIGGTVNSTGRLVITATRIGADTQLSRMARLVADAQSGKAASQRLADRVSAVFVPIVILLALGTMIGWLLGGLGIGEAISYGIAVLIIACPCALGLATPTALLVGTGRGAQLGILISGPEVLESTRRVDTVLLDKTGTVTTGRMSVAAVHPAPGMSEVDALRIAGAAESASLHPIALAIVAAARDTGEELPAVSEFHSVHGLGVQATVQGSRVHLGRQVLLTDSGVHVGAEWDQVLAETRATGQTAVLLAVDGAVRAAIAVADTVRPDAASTVAELRALRLRPVLLTGDNGASARAVAEQIGVDEVIAEVTPEGKLAVVREQQAAGRVVAMVGDGVNDAAALAGADLGLAMGTGTDAAMQSGDLTVVRGDLPSVVTAVRLARRTLRTIQGNLFWAFAYNVCALPLAVLGLLNPMIAGAAMAASSLFVIGNSLRLRTFR